MTAPGPLLRVEGLAVHAPDRAVLEPISFDLHPGRVLGLVGESGSGKTSLGRALLGEVAPGLRRSGTVRTTARVGYVPQHAGSALTPARRVGSVMAEVAAIRLRRAGRRLGRRAVAEAVASATARAGFDETLLRRHPHQLSGGQQQRCAIAQVLLTDPEVLVADEPTTGQDPEHRAAVLAELRRLVAEGLSLVLLSHDLESVCSLADETIVLRRGRVVERGARVWDEPSTPYARALLGPAATVPADERTASRLSRSTSPRPPVLRVSGLTAHHRRRRVLADLVLHVDRAECLVVTGRSGSGKSTLARTLVGLHRRATATMLLADEPLAVGLRGRSVAQRAAVQYAFQDGRASLDPYRSVLGQVSDSGVRLRGWIPREARARARDLLDRLALDDRVGDARPAQLSGGQAQRAALARCLIVEPAVLLCDEVTAGLDVLTRAGVLDLLDAVRHDRGTALVVVTHERAVVDRMADRVLDLDLHVPRADPPAGPNPRPEPEEPHVHR